MNSVNLIGRLTADPELRFTQNQTSVCGFSIAVDRDYSDGVDFIDCVAWKNNAEFITKYFHKGQKIGITGRISVRAYQDKHGYNRKAVEVVVEHSYFCEKKAEPELEPTPDFEPVEDDPQLPF